MAAEFHRSEAFREAAARASSMVPPASSTWAETPTRAVAAPATLTMDCQASLENMPRCRGSSGCAKGSYMPEICGGDVEALQPTRMLQRPKSFQQGALFVNRAIWYPNMHAF